MLCENYRRILVYLLFISLFSVQLYECVQKTRRNGRFFENDFHRVTTGQEVVREQTFFKISEKSGNFILSQGKLIVEEKAGKIEII